MMINNRYTLKCQS